MKVRLATVADAGILAELIQNLQGLHADAVPRVFKQPTAAPVREEFERNLLANPDSRAFIAEVDGEPAGYVYTLIARRREDVYNYPMQFIHIDHLSVRPEFQQQGCGRALMQAVFDLANNEGVERVTLDTWAFNTEAHKFFAKMGFGAFMLRMETFLVNETEQV